MSPAPLTLAIAVLVPVMLGPAPASAAPATLTAELCGGGTITIPLAPRDTPADKSGCHPKGCHAGTCRPKDEHKRPHRSN